MSNLITDSKWKRVLGFGLLLAAVAIGVVLLVTFLKAAPCPHPEYSGQSEVFAVGVYDTSTDNHFKRGVFPDYKTASAKACEIGYSLATYKQVLDAWHNGFEVCGYGWIEPTTDADDPPASVVQPSQGTKDATLCGAFGMNAAKGTAPESNASLMLVYGPKPPPRGNGVLPLYFGTSGNMYYVTPFSTLHNKWSQYST